MNQNPAICLKDLIRQYAMTVGFELADDFEPQFERLIAYCNEPVLFVEMTDHKKT